MKSLNKEIHEHESTVIRGCRRLLELLEAENKLTFVRINVSGVRRSVGNQTIYTKNEMAGMEDFQVYLNTFPPITLFIECKSVTGVLSLAQKRRKDKLANVGHKDYYIVRSMDNLADILGKFGIKHWAYGESN